MLWNRYDDFPHRRELKLHCRKQALGPLKLCTQLVKCRNGLSKTVTTGTKKPEISLMREAFVRFRVCRNLHNLVELQLEHYSRTR